MLRFARLLSKKKKRKILSRTEDKGEDSVVVFLIRCVAVAFFRTEVLNRNLREKCGHGDNIDVSDYDRHAY